MSTAPAGTASILHADLDAFFASVEQRDNPALRGLPVIVGGGVVLAASYEAKAHGVKTAMGGRQAKSLCPGAVVVPPRFEAYSEASKAVFEVFKKTSPVVEGVSIDEAFIDVSGLLRSVGSPASIAEELRRRVYEDVGLRITVGVARTKFLAKVASGVAKPDGLLIVPTDKELEFLHPLAVERLWGVGKVSSEKLRAYGIRTVAQVATMDEATLQSILGSYSARHLLALAHNRDPRPVQSGKRRRSMGAQHALGRGVHAPQEIDRDLLALVDRVTRRMRAAERRGRTVVLRLRFDDFTRATRSHTLFRSTDQTEVVADAARTLLQTAMPMIRERGLTLVGVAVLNFDDEAAAEQLELPFGELPNQELDRALDSVREKFGAASVTRGVLLGRDTGFVMPGLPEGIDEPG